MLRLNRPSPQNDTALRRGAFMVLAFFTLVVTMGFVAFSIDTGHIALNKTIMQNGVDAAALAAAMEITSAIENAPPGEPDPTAYAREQAKIVAADTALLNGVYVDSNVDVEFGLRSFNAATQQFEIAWGVEPSNAVKVKARRDNDDVTQPDGKLPLLFAGVLGEGKTTMGAEAIAYIESRDISVVLDFSGSMRFDSLFRWDSVNRLGADAIRDNLRDMYWELGLADGDLGTLDHTDPNDSASAVTPELKWLVVHRHGTGIPGSPSADVTFKYGQVSVDSDQQYDRIWLRFSDGHYESINDVAMSGTYSGSGSHYGSEIDYVWVGFSGEYIYFDDSNANVKSYFGLTNLPYPFASGDWDSYINNIRSDSDINRGGHREMYGGITFMHYTLEQKPYHWQTPELARTSHYPFHAVRAGNELFVDFLANLGFGDHVGLVSYDQSKRQEMILEEDGYSIDLSADPLGEDYDAIKIIMQHKQSSHYTARTNIGGGLREARKQITDHGRTGARPTILLMTDGNANVYENTAGGNNLEGGFSNDGFYQVPGNFDWSVFSDLEGTNVFPFTINDDGGYMARSRIYALSQAWKAVQEGTTVHTMAVGSGADTDLMKAIAFIGGGEYIEVQGALTVENLLLQVEAGFYRIAALVPPARLADPAATTP